MSLEEDSGLIFFPFTIEGILGVGKGLLPVKNSTSELLCPPEQSPVASLGRGPHPSKWSYHWAGEGEAGASWAVISGLGHRALLETPGTLPELC